MTKGQAAWIIALLFFVWSALTPAPFWWDVFCLIGVGFAKSLWD